jgi:two-component system phosphate regulon sensor histidine kinase PhoR
VPKRNILLLAACAVLVSIFLVIPSSTTRFYLAVSIFLATVAWLLVTFLFRRPSASHEPGGPNAVDEKQTAGRVFLVGDLFEATLESMREGLVVVNSDMRVVASNKAALKLFNLSPPQIESQRLTELTRNPAIYSAFLDALKGIQRDSVKVEIHSPERQVYDLRVLPLGHTNGNGADGALGVFINITRTERLEIVRQEFLSNVSHELRTPLTAVMAFVETLENGAMEDRESSQRFLSIIRKNASRMHSLIDDILELTAIEGGNVTLRSSTVDLHPLVNDVIASLGAKAQAHGITLTNHVRADIRVYGDARRLEQMLTNLVDNGIKFSRENGSVTIRYEGNDRDCVVVEDNGEGIPSQHLERLFERFYRVDRARSRDLGGTGLGLAIVKHLALLHGGEVTVTSELGKGTAFTIHLPRVVS